MTQFKLADKIKIDVVSDVVCPWCIIGYKRLEKAIEELGIEDQIELEWQPFELNPQMPEEGEDIQEHVARKYGSSPEDYKRSLANMNQLGEELGFQFDYFEGMKIVNTRDAHILLNYAKENGKQNELNLLLVAAHFSEQKDVSNRDILIREVEKLGLNTNEAITRLDNKKYLERVQEQEEYWQNRGITAVPTVVFNNTIGLTGAQSIEVYRQVLTDLIQK